MFLSPLESLHVSPEMQGEAGSPDSLRFPVPGKLMGRRSLGREQRLSEGSLKHTHAPGYPGAQPYQCTEQSVLRQGKDPLQSSATCGEG